jgi:hypothetical protein
VIAALLLLAACPSLAPAPATSGTTSVVHTPSAAAMALNTEGKALYKANRWAEARAKYLAALAADPAWLPPALNAACALARQDHFAEAAREAAALVRRAFVPWGRETLEAADLAGLHVRPEMNLLRTAVSEAAGDWGRAVKDAVVFVARTRPPVRLGGEGTLYLGLGQELFAWSPASGRYHQLTADDGRVLAVASSVEGGRLVYLRAGKLVRDGRHPARLRGLSLRRLELATMTLGPPVELPGDVDEVALWAGQGAVAAELRVKDGAATRLYRVMGEALVPAPALSPEAQERPPVRLTGRGAVEPGRLQGPPACSFRATDERGPGQPPRIRVRAGARSIVLEAPLGAGLQGLPF